MSSGLVGHFRAMARNNAWSNHRLLTACHALTPGEFAARRTGFFPSLRATLNHILWVDTYYIDALLGDPGVLARYGDPPPDFADATSLEAAQRASDRRLLAFCEGQTAESLEGTCILPRPGRVTPPERVADVLAHLFQHQTHHRGQAHAMLSGTRVEPPQLDEFFLSNELHKRRDELRALGLPEV